jgi:hypothetical protein
MNDETRKERFGCSRCWPDAAEAAWQGYATLAVDTVLVDESHFRVAIRLCPFCSQRFVSVFSETIDWADGDDPQYWSLLPVTAAEIDALTSRTGTVAETALESLGSNRRGLRHDHPKGRAAVSYWAAGVALRPHD